MNNTEDIKIHRKARLGTVLSRTRLDSSTSEMDSSDTDDMDFVKGSFSQTKSSRMKLNSRSSPRTDMKIVKTRRSNKRSVTKKYKQTIIVQDDNNNLWYKTPSEKIEESSNKVVDIKSNRSAVIPQKKSD